MIILLWKLWDNYSENEFQERMLQQAIQDKEYLQILGSQEWKIPLYLHNIKLTTATKMKIDILKKMIMHTMLNMEITSMEQLSEFLHVDSLFIYDIVSEMKDTGAIEEQQGAYGLTQRGIEQYNAGMILSKPIQEDFLFMYSAFNKEVVLREKTNLLVNKDWDIDTYRYGPENESLEGKVLEEALLRQFIKQSGTDFEIGGNEKIISKIGPVELKEEKYAKCIEYQLYDMLDDKVYTRVWNGALGRWDERFEEEIHKYESEQWKAQYNEAIIQNFPERYEYLRNTWKTTNKKGKKKVLHILRGKDIRDKFLNSFTETKRKMLMVSPWISNHVVDREMLERLQKFAKQNKTLYISWGIAKNRNNEDRLPSVELLEQLRGIKHADGTQAVFVRWFGNQHNKEIVVDSKYHLLGSFNWLSYRGDYDIRHESVVMVNDEKVITDTTEYIEEKFITALEKELNDFLFMRYSNVEEVQMLNWMKELVLLDSSFEKRKQLSDKLITFLRENQKEEVLYEIACLWARYNAEDFGVRSYLSELLKQEKLDLAKEYVSLCLKHIPTSVMWDRSPELKDYKDWMTEQMNAQPVKKAKVKATGKGKGRPRVKK
ncbi:hypothetical protein CN425_02380 [Bacillus cereus]|uniref:PLD phosphodiesterase domain-containing protein n=1 Tax=Bacillus cereus TaxID=1396 RepID=A0A2A8Q1A2_BACCE|nr:hypothetical protein [Bacillus cereus]EJS65850.1 hypothetical protein ICU_03924 [Bacillus cereus BAG2X1-1]EJS73992.1 hypothetical protein ICY_03778 [Bacillus cereus BAG2X1-3]PEA07933.1 hypothetical protein CON38_19810 [Bacillus cereus]PEW06157.1 hypothetical protein CN425_02380 [Bacillus cereus]